MELLQFHWQDVCIPWQGLTVHTLTNDLVQRSPVCRSRAIDRDASQRPKLGSLQFRLRSYVRNSGKRCQGSIKPSSILSNRSEAHFQDG